jgi:hypothetical protein
MIELGNFLFLSNGGYRGLSPLFLSLEGLLESGDLHIGTQQPSLKPAHGGVELKQWEQGNG